jgi:hypothetical protein
MYERCSRLTRPRILGTGDIVSFPLFALALWYAFYVARYSFEEVLAYVSFIW